MIREPEAVNTCAGYFDRMWSKAKEKLTHKKLRKWQREIDAAERKDKWRGKESYPARQLARRRQTARSCFA